MHFGKLYHIYKNKSGLACNAEYSWTGGSFYLWKTAKCQRYAISKHTQYSRNILRLLLYQLQYNLVILIYIKIVQARRYVEVVILVDITQYISVYFPGVTH